MSSSKPRAGRGTAHRTAALSVLLLGCIGSVSAAGGDPNVTMVAAARSGMMAAQRPSWVQGTSASALLELEGAPAWNYFAGTNNGPVYRAGNLNPGASGLPIDVLNMGYHAVAAQDGAGRLCSRITGEERLNAGSSLDSSNCAMPVLLAAVSVGQLSDNNADGSGYYADAAAAQLAFVTQRTNRTRDGAISQRNDDLQIWSDSMMMISSLGVYGLMYDNQTLLQLAYDQLRLYREALLQPNGMVAHIYDVSNNSFSDGSSWATGNGWATAGMLRVIACIAQSSHASAMLQQQADLFGWTASILDAAYTYADANTGLVRNHINETESFLDAAGSMLIAYSTFRLASMAANSDQHVDAAEKIYSTVQGRLDPFGHFFDIQTADALTFSEPGPTSPEALAFALLLAAARRDYAAKNVTGIYGPGTNNRAPPSVVNGQLMQGAVVPGANSAASVPLPALLTVSALALLATILIS